MATTPGTTLEGNYDADGLRFGIVCARFNRLFVDHLLAGAIDAIVRHGGSADLITVAWVPGSYEIPVVAKEMANTDVDAVIALGVVIDGATSHASHINSAVTSALTSISCDSGIPVIGGVVNCANLEQATERCGTKAGNRGFDAACSAIEMANLIKQFDD